MNKLMPVQLSPEFRGRFHSKKVSSIDIAYAKELKDIKQAKADSFAFELLDRNAAMSNARNKIQVLLDNILRK